MTKELKAFLLKNVMCKKFKRSLISSIAQNGKLLINWFYLNILHFHDFN